VNYEEKHEKAKNILKRYIQTIKCYGNINNVVTDSTKSDKVCIYYEPLAQSVACIQEFASAATCEKGRRSFEHCIKQNFV
jgi:hypothetical protein